MNSFIKFNLSFLLILYFSCQHTIPISPENQEPMVIQDFWAPLQNSPANRIFSFARDSKGRFYAGTNNGLFRSFDNGNIWENIHSSTPIAIYVSSIDGTILLSLSGSFTTSTVYSIDNGKSWRRPSQPLSGSIGRYLSLPTGEILAGGYFHDESSGGIFISSDRGDTWEQSTLGLWLSVLSFAMNSSNHIFAVIRRFETNSTAVYRSTDQGRAWFQISQFDTTLTSLFNLQINSKDEIFLGMRDGIFISHDNAQSWESIGPVLNIGDIEDMILDSSDNLFLLFYDGEDRMHKILFLPNSTNRWYLLEGLSESLGSRSIVVVGNDHHIYVSTFGRGIYKSKEPFASIYK